MLSEASRKNRWKSIRIQDTYRWPANEYFGKFNSHTFPKEDLWKGPGIQAYRTGIDVFAVRLHHRTLVPGDIVYLRKDGFEFMCEVIKFVPTNTEEVKSKNCGVAVLDCLRHYPANSRRSTVPEKSEPFTNRPKRGDPISDWTPRRDEWGNPVTNRPRFSNI